VSGAHPVGQSGHQAILADVVALLGAEVSFGVAIVSFANAWHVFVFLD
jgi:hypothetical protein